MHNTEFHLTVDDSFGYEYSTQLLTDVLENSHSLIPNEALIQHA